MKEKGVVLNYTYRKGVRKGAWGKSFGRKPKGQFSVALKESCMYWKE